jgi:hypothetical protein
LIDVAVLGYSGIAAVLLRHGANPNPGDRRAIPLTQRFQRSGEA